MNKYDKILWERFGTPIGMMAGQPLVGVRDERSEDDDVCPSCNMLSVGGMCGCDYSSEEVDACPQCGMMAVDGQCGCGESCPVCNQMPMQSSCGCGDKALYSMMSQEESEDYLKEDAKMCAQCGMNESMCECGMNEVAPPGHEKMVKGLKKAQKKGDVENAYAVAWHHYKTKHPDDKGKKHKS